jgi:hypothetical protein
MADGFFLYGRKCNSTGDYPEDLDASGGQNGKLFSNYQYVDGRVFGLKRSNMCFGLKDEKISING